MLNKIFKVLTAVFLVFTVSVGSIAQDNISKTKQHKTAEMQRQQAKVDKIKQTKEGQETFRLVAHYSRMYKMDHKLISAIILMESGFNHQAKSKSSSATGLMQLTNVHRGKVKGCNNLYDKKCNIEIGVLHVAGLHAKYNGNLEHTISAYNAGGGATDRSLKTRGTIPNKAYVRKVLEYRMLFD